MQGVDPKWVFYLGIIVTIETALGQGTVSLTNVAPEWLIPYIKGWSTLLAFIGTAVMTALSGYSSRTAGPLITPPSASTVAKALTWLIVPIALAVLLIQPAHAQQKKIGGPIGGALDKIQNDINTRNAGQIASGNDIKLTGDPITDLRNAIQKGGQKLVLHLKQSYALAMAKGATGTVVDNTSAMCTKALVPIVDLVVNGPKPGTVDAADAMALSTQEQTMAADTSVPEGAVVQVEKMRILRLTLESPALNDACGALVQDEVKNAQNLVGKITSLITGAGMAGIGLPIP